MMLFLCEYVASSFFFLLYSPQTRARAICNCRCIIIITSNHTKQIHTGLRLQSHKIQLISLFFSKWKMSNGNQNEFQCKIV